MVSVRTEMDPGQHIWLLTAKNPKKIGTASHPRFARYRHGMTVAEAREVGLGPDCLRWDSERGYIRLGGEDPGEPTLVAHQEPPEGSPSALVRREQSWLRVGIREVQPGLWAREGTYDERIIAEIEPCYGWLPVEGQVVLDVGANVGYFSSWALGRGASEVHAYEPEPANFELLRLNAPSARASCSALVSEVTGDEALWISPTGINPGSSTLTPMVGREPLPVAAERWADVVEKVRPVCIKMDCEGAEYDLLGAGLPDSVLHVAAELHLNRRDWREECLPRLLSLFEDWRVVRAPVLNDRRWTTIAGWSRI